MPTEAIPEIPAVVETPAPVTPQKIVFDPAQQAKVNALIQEAQGRAAKDVRAELAAAQAREAALQAELNLHKAAVTPELAEARARLAEESTAKSAAIQREERALSAIALRELLEAESVISVSDAAALLSPQVSWKDGQLVGADGRAVAEIIKDFVRARPHMVKSSVRSGTGSFESQQTAPVNQYHLEDYFGSKSNGQLVNNLARTNNKLYKQLRQKALAAGLVR